MSNETHDYIKFDDGSIVWPVYIFLAAVFFAIVRWLWGVCI